MARIQSSTVLKALVLVAGLAALAPPAVGAQTAAASVEEVFSQFWAAGSPAGARLFVDAIADTGVTFDEAFERLSRGRDYEPQATGILAMNNRTDGGIEHYYSLNVPDHYDPNRQYQIRIQLHGGIGRRTNNQPRGSGEINLPGAEQIYVLPYAWLDVAWWSGGQVSILNAIVDRLKRSYNIDENRIVVSGVSDGGTGAYYIGMHDVTPYASFLPLNGFIMVLANNQLDDGTSFPSNMRNKPWFVINGGQDRLYPTATVEPFVRHMMSNGVRTAYHPQPDAGHNTSWWPDMKDTFEKFVKDNPRDPHPDTVSWETADLTYNRAHWLVIDEFLPRSRMHTVSLDSDPIGRFPATDDPLFRRTMPSGRVELIRMGNTVEATTTGVATFTLLLSTDEFDFSEPVRVVANGDNVFDGRLEPDVRTLLKWAARDNDRTMLYGAELQIELDR